jgi:hypothetical protein
METPQEILQSQLQMQWQKETEQAQEGCFVGSGRFSPKYCTESHTMLKSSVPSSLPYLVPCEDEFATLESQALQYKQS